jgi:hypothetical protein
MSELYRDISPVTIKRSPWGIVEFQTNYAPGVDVVVTPGHGGFKLSPEQNALIPELFRKADGWYEEDCEYAVPVFFLDVPGFRDKKDRAEKTLRVWFWKQYEMHFGVVLPPGVSMLKDEYVHKFVNAAKFVVRSALNIGNGKTGVLAVRASDGVESWFVVPADEYRSRGSLPFVIDETRHQKSERPLF